MIYVTGSANKSDSNKCLHWTLCIKDFLLEQSSSIHRPTYWVSREDKANKWSKYTERCEDVLG